MDELFRTFHNNQDYKNINTYINSIFILVLGFSNTVGIVFYENRSPHTRGAKSHETHAIGAIIVATAIRQETLT